MLTYVKSIKKPKIKQIVKTSSLTVPKNEFPANSISFLHQTVGNQSVRRMIRGTHSSLTVVRGEKDHSPSSVVGSQIQGKLKIGQPNDKYEQEADRVAKKVMTMPTSTCTSCKEEENVQPKLIDKIFPLIQCQEIDEEEEEEVIQPKGTTNDRTEVTSEIESYIFRTKGSGNPLPFSTRAFMEKRFGVDFDEVRIHADSEAARMTRALNAEAFTYGKDIYFGEGRYRPETTEGKRLLAHELTHVVQQETSEVPVLQKEEFSFEGLAEPMCKPEEALPKEPEMEHPEVCISGPPLKDRADLLFTILSAAYIDLDANAWEWIDAAEKFGLCYYDAYKNHKETIEKQEKHAAIKKELAFLVLNIVTTGTLASLSTLAQSKKWVDMAEWKVNAIEDMIQTATGKTLDLVAKPKPINVVTKNPLRFYLEIKESLSTHVNNSKSFLNKYVQWAKNVKIKVVRSENYENYMFLEGFNAKNFEAKVNCWKSRVVLFQDAPSIPKEELTKELEIGMWAKWAASTLIKPTKKTICRGVPGAATFCRTYETEEVNDPGSIVEKRLDELGITKACGVGDWGLWTFDWEVRKLVEWGRDWKPQHVFNI